MAVEMKILKDRSEWLENRKNGIGGSEISAVLGLNPYMDNVTLWEYKTGRRQPEDISDKPYVEYGTQAEMHLRGLFRLDFPQYHVEYVDNNSFRNDKYPWALASLDGWLFEESEQFDVKTSTGETIASIVNRGRFGILEIKTTEILNSMHKEKWNDQIPNNYYCQILFYMAVCEADFAILKAQLKTVFDGVPYLQTKHYHIERSEVQEDIDLIMKKGAEFWEYVKADKRPPLQLPEV